MKRKVLALDKSCDITPEDVNSLPWLCRGKFLDLRVMNQMFFDDWQGDKKKDDDDDDDDDDSSSSSNSSSSDSDNDSD